MPRNGLWTSRRGGSLVPKGIRSKGAAALVRVADREVDMIALMECAQELGAPADRLIRSTANFKPDAIGDWVSRNEELQVLSSAG